MSREIMQMALRALKAAEALLPVNYKRKWIGIEAIAALEAELAKPTNEFHPDWDTLKPYHDRIAELEAQLAKPEYPDLRQAAEMALEYLNELEIAGLDHEVHTNALRQALAQGESTSDSSIHSADSFCKQELHNLMSVAGRMALELECLLLDTKDLSVVSKWWDTGMESLQAYRDYIWSITHGRDEIVALAQPEQEPVKKALRLKPHECICGYSVGHPLVPKCICKPEYTAQPEHPLDKKADNARELGLDYEPDHGFDRTASHMAGGYVDTAQYLHMSDRQRLEAIVDVVCRYLPPDGISRKQALIEIIALVDPLPEQPEQEPVAIIDDGGFAWGYGITCGRLPSGTKVYAAPNVSIKQQNINTSEERAHKSEECVHEPVAWASTNDQVCALLRQAHDVLAIASFPPKREWQGLTDEELNNISEYGNTDWTKRKSLARAIQAKLREKNT